MSKKQSINATTNNQTKSLYRFSIKVTSLQESVVTDNETGKTYKCKNVWYTRNNTKRFYVNVEAVANKAMKSMFYVNVEAVANKAMKSMFSFPWSAIIMDNGKLKGTNPVGTVIETNLAGKQAAMITEDMFC